MAAPLAGRSGASCCVVRRAPGVLWVPPVSVRQRLWGGERVCLCGAGLWVMSHRRMPSRCVSWRVSRRLQLPTKRQCPDLVDREDGA